MPFSTPNIRAHQVIQYLDCLRVNPIKGRLVAFLVRLHDGGLPSVRPLLRLVSSYTSRGEELVRPYKYHCRTAPLLLLLLE